MIHPEAFKALLTHNKGALTRLPRMAHPTLIANRYGKRIRESVLADAFELVRAKLVPQLEAMSASASRIATTDAREDLGQTVDEIEAEYFRKWSRKRFAKVVQPIAQNVESFQAMQLNRALRPMIGVDVIGAEPWIADTVAEFVTENVALIKSVPTRLFDDLEQHLTRGIADGLRWEELATTIEKQFKVSEARAELIARDQAGKFFGDLNRVRQTDLGITSFVWRTSGDDRVREEHQAREGNDYKWSAPPDGETPGEPVLCRCYAEPNLTALLSED